MNILLHYSTSINLTNNGISKRTRQKLEIPVRRIVALIIVWLSIQVHVPRFDLASKESLKISSKTYFLCSAVKGELLPGI